MATAETFTTDDLICTCVSRQVEDGEILAQGIATPLVIHWPEGIKDKNAFRNMPAHIIDIAPTMLELAGAEPGILNSRTEAPGISLVPILGEDLKSERPPIFFHHERKKALRHGDWKITTIEEDGPWELYDLSLDRGETNNLAEQNPEKLQELISLWEAQRNQIIEQVGAVDLNVASIIQNNDPL